MSVTPGVFTCVPHAGHGLVARLNGELFLVVGGDAAAQERLLHVCRGVASKGGDGRALVRALAGEATATWDEMPPCAVLAPAGDRMVVFVHGDADVVAGDLGTLSGRDSVGWVDRILEWPATGLSATLSGAGRAMPGAYDLRDGAVPGAGFTLSAQPQPSAEPVTSDASEPDPGGDGAYSAQPEERGEPADAEEAEAPEPSPEAVSPELIPTDEWQASAEDLGVHPSQSDDDRPTARSVLEAADDDEASRVTVQGVHCVNGHFNDPRQPACVVCGAPPNSSGLTAGPRPPLGVLVLDDRSAYPLDGDYVIGRDPGRDESVASGRRRPLALQDDHKTVSRAHARIELRDWDVVLFDNGSANGTFAAAEGETTWQYVPPGHPYVLRAGARLLIGRRTLIYQPARIR
jgi:hypothetical protein